MAAVSFLLGIPLVFSYSLMWVGHMDYWYYLLTYLFFDVVYTMILVPYETLVPEMTDDFKQKTKFSGARIGLAQLSAILAAFLPGILLGYFGKDNAVSFFYSSLVFSIICACMLTLVYLFTWERPAEQKSAAALEAEKQKLTLLQSLKRLNVELSSTLRIRFGPAPSYRVVVVLFGMAAISYSVLYYANLSDVFSLLLLVSGLADLGRGGINYVPWNTYTYIADVDEVITGQHREGIAMRKPAMRAGCHIWSVGRNG